MYFFCVLDRRSVVVNDRGALYSRRRGRDSNAGGSRDRYHHSHSDIIFNGNIHRLQASVRIILLGNFSSLGKGRIDNLIFLLERRMF